MTLSVLDPASLEANRAGRLTDGQRTVSAGAERVLTGQVRGLAVVFAAIGLLVAFGAADRVPPVTRFAVAGAFLVAAVVAGWFSFAGRPGLERDLREGRVVAVEGAIGRDRLAGQGGQPATYYLTIDGRRYRCSREAYDSAAEPGIVRLYVLPHSRRLVNFERLPDRPLPAGLTDPPGAMTTAVRAAAGGLLHGGTDRAEALATMAAVEHAMLGQSDHPAQEPAAAQPLVEAIVGTWQNALLRATFDADGSARATTMAGTTLSGRWSVDASGSLMLTGMGGQEVTDARVGGDVMTLVLDGRSISLRRTAG